MVPQYEIFRDSLVSWLETLGIAKGAKTASAGMFARALL